MTSYCSLGGPDAELTDRELRDALLAALEQLGPRQRVLALPPDLTRLHSRAGLLTCMAW